MSEECQGSCGSCSADCSSRKPTKEELLEPSNSYSNIKKVIGVVSGKGGVGKSFVTSYLSVLLNRKGYKTAILDADVTGPSIPKAFGLHKKVSANEMGIFPGVSENGTRIMSINLLLDSEEIPVIWRGPIIAGTVKQFWSEVVWGDIDYMFVDMPPGTGDVPLTVFQSIPLDGIIIVTSPQELVSMIVAKAVNMAASMEIPVLGIIENYSYVSCGKCGEKIQVFGKSHVDETAEKFGTKVLGNLPLDPAIAESVDQEKIQELTGNWLDDAVSYLEGLMGEEKQKPKGNQEPAGEKRRQKIAVAADENGDIFGHFGSTKTFAIYEVEGNSLIGKSTLFVEGSGHSELAGLLEKQGVEVLICGGIGSAALDMLLNSGIVVIPGQQGDVEVSVAAYMDGSLLGSNTATCPGHEEGEGCGCGCSCHQ